MTLPSCEIALLVQAAFDGELDSAQAAEVAAHRNGCAACQAVHAELSSLRQLLATEKAADPAPDALRARIAQRIAHKPNRRLVPALAGAALAASLALLLLHPGAPPLMDEVVASHIRSLQADHLTDIASSDRHTVKPWFDGKLDFAPPVKDFASAGFPLTGGRLDYIGHRPVATLVYEQGNHPINVFIWPVSGGDTAPAANEEQGYHVVHFIHGRMEVWIVSDLEASHLSEFAALLRQ